ncbi:MAG: metallophosphoesterase family protein [Anaerolineales bacterium]
MGDYGLAGVPLEAVATLVKSWQPALIITVGDNNYPIGAAKAIDDNVGQYFHDYISPYNGKHGEGAGTNRFFPVMGNHDWEVNTAPQPYTDFFTLPGNERYYDFVWGPVHFFALDSDSREPDGVGLSSVQGQWLQTVLAASTAPWKIVYMHHPPYSSSRHGSTLWMQWPYQEWGADAALAGHDHTYERIVIDGFPYFVNGLGGNPNRYYFFSTLYPDSQAHYRKGHGAMRVTAAETQITFEFITVDGEVIDTYTMTR